MTIYTPVIELIALTAIFFAVVSSDSLCLHDHPTQREWRSRSAAACSRVIFANSDSFVDTLRIHTI